MSSLFLQADGKGKKNKKAERRIYFFRSDKQQRRTCNVKELPTIELEQCQRDETIFSLNVKVKFDVTT